ncbi:hypothetical protein ACLOJK_039449 [Asimina triloba]
MDWILQSENKSTRAAEHANAYPSNFLASAAIYKRLVCLSASPFIPSFFLVPAFKTSQTKGGKDSALFSFVRPSSLASCIESRNLHPFLYQNREWGIPSKMTWAGEDWSQLDPEHDRSINGSHRKAAKKEESTEEESLLGGKTAVSSTEVKIKISKKQLEELLGKFDVQGMTFEQLLTQLIDAGSTESQQLRHRPWKPALQSIPESSGIDEQTVVISGLDVFVIMMMVGEPQMESFYTHFLFEEACV